jgi:hypothetical protein
MEYYRAYWDETPDSQLINRHKREIFPLLHRRHLFAEMDNFFLYDFYISEPSAQNRGIVNEDVFAYSNRVAEERSLVIYHNRWAEVRGRIKTSTAYRVNDALVQTNLGEGLGLKNDASYFTIFRDHVNGLEYIRNNRELHEQGLYVELGAYKYQVFLDFREVADNEWGQYNQLAAHLKGRGVPDIDETLREIFLQPLHYAFRELVNADTFGWLIENSQPGSPDNTRLILIEIEQKMLSFLRTVKKLTGCECESDALSQEVVQKLEAALHLPVLAAAHPLPSTPQYNAAIKFITGDNTDDPLTWGIIFGWVFTHSLGKIFPAEDSTRRSRALLEEWLLPAIIEQALHGLGLNEKIARNAVAAIRIMISHQNWFRDSNPPEARPSRVLQVWLEDSEVRRFLLINRYNEILWFNKEAFEMLRRLMLTMAAISTCADPDIPAEQIAPEIVSHYQVIANLGKAASASGYQVEELLAAAGGREVEG